MIFRIQDSHVARNNKKEICMYYRTVGKNGGKMGKMWTREKWGRL